MKNIQRIFILIFVLTLCACFSEWTGDEGTITIALGAAPRYLYYPGDVIPRFSHTVTLEGPGGIVQERFTGTNAVMRVMPGRWNLTVKAYYPYKDDGGKWHGEVLRAMGEKTITVKAGQNKTETVTMISASVVESFEELRELANLLSDYPEEEEIVIIKNDISLDYSMDDDKPEEKIIGIRGRITLIAETDVTIFTVDNVGRDGGYFSPGLFHIYERGYLTLGRAGMSGTITLDGRNITEGAEYMPLISVDAGGVLLMNNKVTLRNNRFSAVEIFGSEDYPYEGDYEVPADDPDWLPPGIFIMNGGDIVNNTGATVGGGVYNKGYGGTFTMNGGTISNNEAIQGGGVYNGPMGTFTMNGGTISGNTASESGGGVYNEGTVNLREESIMENKPNNVFSQQTRVTVTFNVNGGEGTAPAVQTVNLGSNITLPGGDGMTRTGYTFGGWNTNAEGRDKTYSAGSFYTVTGNVTLYAMWNN